MPKLKNFLLITFVVFLPVQFVLGEVSLVNTDAGTYRGHSSQHADAVSYTHLTLPPLYSV